MTPQRRRFNRVTLDDMEGKSNMALTRLLIDKVNDVGDILVDGDYMMKLTHQKLEEHCLSAEDVERRLEAHIADDARHLPSAEGARSWREHVTPRNGAIGTGLGGLITIIAYIIAQVV